MNQPDFLAALTAAVTDQRRTVQFDLALLDAAQLNQRLTAGSWSALECLEHLNRYSRYYLPALAAALSRPATPSAAPVAYSWLGAKSVALVRPDNQKKQATLKHMNPLGSRLDARQVLAGFDQHQAHLLELLTQAAATDLNRRAVPVEFFRLLKLRLGEALEFVVVHQQRHLGQALRTQAALRPALAC